MSELHQYAGIIAGILSFLAYPKYIYEILKGETKPSRVTWWILGLSNALITLTYYASGARDTIWIPISYTVGFLSVGFLSLKYGEGSWGRSETICVIGALLSATVWYFFRSPEIALYLIMLVDFIGLAPTIYKAYKRPATEDKDAWLLGTIASALNLVAIETLTFAVISYPVYVFITNAAILFFIFFPSRASRLV